MQIRFNPLTQLVSLRTGEQAKILLSEIQVKALILKLEAIDFDSEISEIQSFEMDSIQSDSMEKSYA
jgi:hypothetical protein